VLVLPADMPEITTEDLRAVAAAFDGAHVLRGAGADGTPGHPVLFPAAALPALAALSGERGARDLAAGARLVTLPGRHALTDLDTPEDWADWRAARP
ncbi:MAG: nucleotidyltransferase family protein, partial [Alphaproteobacteria bacterium HGW-Alphaproteobacteria-2]